MELIFMDWVYNAYNGRKLYFYHTKIKIKEVITNFKSFIKKTCILRSNDYYRDNEQYYLCIISIGAKWFIKREIRLIQGWVCRGM